MALSFGFIYVQCLWYIPIFSHCQTGSKRNHCLELFMGVSIKKKKKITESASIDQFLNSAQY